MSWAGSPVEETVDSLLGGSRMGRVADSGALEKYRNRTGRLRTLSVRSHQEDTGPMIRRALVPLIAVLLTAPAVARGAAPASAATPGLNGRLLYAVPTAGPNPKSEIVTANPDGSGAINLTKGAGSDAIPAWSPDGSKIAF